MGKINSLSVGYMCTHIHAHIHIDGCIGVCAFGDCFLQCTISSINLTHFKVIHMGQEILLGKSSKLWKEIKTVSAGENEKVSKTSSVCHFNALPMSCLKPKQLKSPKRTVFCLKGPSRERGAVLCITFRPYVCRAAESV